MSAQNWLLLSLLPPLSLVLWRGLVGAMHELGRHRRNGGVTRPPASNGGNQLTRILEQTRIREAISSSSGPRGKVLAEREIQRMRRLRNNAGEPGSSTSSEGGSHGRPPHCADSEP